MGFQPTYSEFSDPRLVAIYNTVNPVAEYRDFYVDLARGSSSQTIVDFGCGSGLLTRELASRGRKVIGIEPSSAMLDLARSGSLSDRIRWIHGGIEKLAEFEVDLALMTGHVAQFFLSDDEWSEALSGVFRALKPGGLLSFETRNPNAELFAGWPKPDSPKRLHDPSTGPIEWWWELLEHTGGHVRYENHYRFVDANEELVSLNELRFRTLKEVTDSLAGAGFDLKHVYGNWDLSPVSENSAEMIFIAERP